LVRKGGDRPPSSFLRHLRTDPERRMLVSSGAFLRSPLP
jgi:hypothetical protein